MQYISLALAFAALAAAAPTPAQEEFRVYFSVNGDDANPVFVSANLASANGADAGNFVLKGERLSVYPGTPAYFSGGTVNKDLVFDTTQVFGAGKATAAAPSIGSTPGIARPIEAFEGDNVHDLEWGVLPNGEIYHLKAQANNQFYACPLKIGEDTFSVLSWGNPTADGKAPEGCKTTKVIQARQAN